ncbi:MAG TPA: hypothetical protein VFC47_02500 [Caulobacteraceae bacterium]|nr:hypothetical protein [Caulobacteraceae bacterium]
MSILSRRLLIVIALAGSLAVGGASAQPAPSPETSRGVKVLEPETNDTPPAPPRSAPAATPTAGPPSPGPVIHFCDRPFAHAQLQLGSPIGFNRSLARRLRSGGRVVVNLTEPYPDKSPPPQLLSSWFAAAQAGGGTVTVKQYCDAARGSLGSWLAGLFRTSPSDRYRSARGYDVVLHADALDRVVTQVEFSPKAAGAGS